MDLNDRKQIQIAIEGRKQELIAGVNDPIAQRWTEKLQKEVEPYLRMRFSPRFGYVIDRWVSFESAPQAPDREPLGYWHQIPGCIGFQEPKPGLCERMKTQYDMWKKSTPKDDEAAIKNQARHPILREKDEQSAKVIAENDRKSTDKVLTAVDSLSERRLKNFIEVERARHTGETIIHHGEDLKFMENVEKHQKSSGYRPPPEDMGKFCGNPGMNPTVYKRKQGGKHIKE